jgi:hypothetical protein
MRLDNPAVKRGIITSGAAGWVGGIICHSINTQ